MNVYSSKTLYDLLESLGGDSVYYALNKKELTPDEFYKQVSSLMDREWECGFYQAAAILFPKERELLDSLSGCRSAQEQRRILERWKKKLQAWAIQQREGGCLGGAVSNKEEA